MPRFAFNKLIRDKIIDQMVAHGQHPTYHVLGTEEHLRALKHKLIEEAHELAEASEDELLTELSDVKQVLDDLMRMTAVTEEAVAAMQASRLQERGGFAKGIFVDMVESDVDDTWTLYYRQHPDKYPEVD